MGPHLNEINAATNLTADQIATLKELNGKLGPKETWEKGKNKILLTHLHDLLEDFHAEYIVKFCRDTAGVIQQEVQRLFPLPPGKILFGGPKSAERISQKYAEYAEQFLSPGTQVYGKFKDLFRASIEYEDYCAVLEKMQFVEARIAAINYRTEGEYQACYVILNIATLNVELKVVKSLAALQESHNWYELKRNGSIENLASFIKRGITKLPAYQLRMDQIPARESKKLELRIKKAHRYRPTLE